MKKVLLISPHADDEILSCWTYLEMSRKEKIDLSISYQAIGTKKSEDEFLQYYNRISTINFLADNFKFKWNHLYLGYDSIMDKLFKREIINKYDKILNESYNEILIPYRSPHQDHQIAHDCVIASLRRNLKSDIIIYEHHNQLAFVENKFFPTRFIPFDNDEKVKWMMEYKPYIKPEDFTAQKTLNRLRGSQIGHEYAEAFQVLREVKEEV